jgi:hypothetical protein
MRRFLCSDTPTRTVCPLIGVGVRISQSETKEAIMPSKTLNGASAPVAVAPENLPHISRAEASAINCLISPSWTEDTLDSVARAIKSIGTLVTSAEQIDYDEAGLYLVFETLAAALLYESSHIESAAAKRQMKEGARK